MEKIKNIQDIKLPNANCLIEVVGRFNLETESGIYLGEELAKYNKGERAVRYGKLVRLPDKINWKKAPWKTSVFPNEGDEIWFDYLQGKDATIVEYEGRKLMILPYFKLFLARNSSNDIKLLNGYLLAQKHPKKGSELLEHKQEHYDDIYDIKFAGKPNQSYKVEKDLTGMTREQFDDTSITEGMTVMTRASAYPVLEEYPHNKFSEETYYIMQRRDVCAEVYEL